MLFSSIRLRNFLSFKDTPLSLGPLNVLIGPNASGKSNLIDAVGLLQAAPRDLGVAVLLGGGVREWIWKGTAAEPLIASLECRVRLERASAVLSYKLSFAEQPQGFSVQEERLQEEPPRRSRKKAKVYFDRRGGKVTLGFLGRDHQDARVSDAESVLSRLKSPADRTPVTRLGGEFERIRIYRGFNTGPLAPARIGVSTSIQKDSLSDSGDNLAVVLLEMEYNRSKKRLEEYLGRFCEGFQEVHVRLEGGIARVYVREQQLSEPTPANRLSDGALKFLCLLAVLLDPQPPSLICMEEPELGLHPDALQLVVEAMLEASQRTQLIVTTHSESLVDALSGQPETVVVCERDPDNATCFRRLDQKQLDVWLERYSLGELWRKGEIGGNRW